MYYVNKSMKQKYIDKLVYVHRGAVMTRVSAVMRYRLRTKKITGLSPKPHKVVLRYAKEFGVTVDLSNKMKIHDYCISLFLDPASPFYHCGSPTNLPKILKSLNQPAVLLTPKKQESHKPKENLSYKEKYRRYLKSAKWKNFKKELVKTRGHKCEKCGEKYRPLDGHHVTYKRLFNELPEDVLLLCHPCHKKEHNK